MDGLTKYYYFILHNGQPISIHESIVDINTRINRIYRRFTAEQDEFYLANPNASVQEVWNCQLIPPYVPPTPDLQEYIDNKLKELKNACCSSISITNLEYNMANAVLAGTSLTYTGEKYYSLSQAKDVMKQFMDESYSAMTLFDTYSSQISSAQSIEAVDSIYNQAITQLNS